MHILQEVGRRAGVFAVLLQAGILLAGTTGKISGIISEDPTGSPLLGADIIVEGTSLGAAAGADGRFTILNVPPGLYTVRISMMGYQTRIVEKVRVRIDLTTTLDARLETTVLQTGESVTVTAERSLVQMDMTSSLSTMGANEIGAIPVENVADVLELQAGLVSEGGSFHIRGGRTGEVAYWVDGIATTDVYGGGLGVAIENSTIQELQVISGTFNAEYGQAMSGIVNIITKEGDPEYRGFMKTYIGDYYSEDDVYRVSKRIQAERNPGTGGTEIFAEEENPLRRLNPEYNAEAGLSGPVPFTKSKARFFLNGRFVSEEGYYYGRRWFFPQGLSGDSALVPLNPFQQISTQGKLSYSLTPNVKLNASFFWNRYGNDRTYSLLFKYNPDGTLRQSGGGSTQIFSLNHLLSKKTFYEFRVMHFRTHYKSYVYEDPLKTPHWLVLVHGAAGDYVIDPKTAEGGTEWTRIRNEQIDYDFIVDPDNREGYVHPDSLMEPAGYSYYRSGADLNHFDRSTSYWTGKLDFTSQLTPVHQVKAGIETRFYHLTLDGFSLLPKTTPDGNEQIVPFEPWIPPLSSPEHNRYDRDPFEMAAYIQDKVEWRDLIMNIGARFDYFDANSVIPADLTDPNIYNPFKPENRYKDIAGAVEYTPDERRTLMHRKTDPKWQISPRLGIAYPISDKGVIHFSYGHFFQIPEFQYLYEAPDFKLISGGLATIVGNADLKPQRTVQYEIGLQQQLSPTIGMDMTVFYRDIRDWVGTGSVIKTERANTSYVMFENKDYSNVRGATLQLEKRFASHYSARLDYTYQVAEGTYSNPRDAFYAYQAQNEPRLSLIPLAWDQRHTLNALFTFQMRQWTLSLIGKFRSGRPYTPAFPKGEVVGGSASVGLPENSERRPLIASMDLYLTKKFPLGGMNASFFFYIYNLLDNRGETGVWGDTGTAQYTTTIDPDDVGYAPGRVSTVEDYVRRPGWYIAPRQIQAGVQIDF